MSNDTVFEALKPLIRAVVKEELAKALTGRHSFPEIAQQIAALKAEDIAAEVDMVDLAREIDLSDIAYQLDYSDIAEHLSVREVADNIDVSDAVLEAFKGGVKISLDR